jgi:iron-sulfur cluster assembly protein
LREAAVAGNVDRDGASSVSGTTGHVLQWKNDQIEEHHMLAVTDNAATVIRDLTSQGEVPEGSGLRIAADAMEGSLTLSLAPQPEEGDQVVDAAGARLFLDSDAAVMLDDKELDAAVDQGGSVQFAVAEQLA